MTYPSYCSDDQTLPRGNAAAFPKFMDLVILVMTGGRERTEAEYRVLLEAAGFRLTKIILIQAAEMNVIEAVPIESKE